MAETDAHDAPEAQDDGPALPMSFAEALIHLRPDGGYNIHSHTYDGIDWLDPDVEKPTRAEIEALTDPGGSGRREATRLAIEAERDRRLAGGYPHDFGSPHGVKVLQTRDGQDRSNWLILQSNCLAAHVTGLGEVEGAEFRCEDNAIVVLSFTGGLQVLAQMAEWGATIMARSWALKDALAAGADPDTLPIAEGWPATGAQPAS